MSATDWLVLAGGIAAIAWVNWYFLFAERRDRAPSPPDEGAPSPDDAAATRR